MSDDIKNFRAGPRRVFHMLPNGDLVECACVDIEPPSKGATMRVVSVDEEAGVIVIDSGKP